MNPSVTFKGMPLSIKGKLPKEGEKLPDCELTNEELRPVKLSSFKGKPLLLLSVPSLDTSVCSTEAARFNKEIDKYKNQLTAVVASMDLPFAQKRWCAAEGVKNLVLLSDFRKRDLGEKLGVLIPDIGLLARCVFVCDPNLTITYVQLVKEITHEPDYAAVLQQLSKQFTKI